MADAARDLRTTWFRAVVAASRAHVERGHRGMWRDCQERSCREAQQFIGPAPAGIDSLPGALVFGHRLDRLDDPEDRRLLGLPRGSA